MSDYTELRRRDYRAELYAWELRLIADRMEHDPDCLGSVGGDPDDVIMNGVDVRDKFYRFADEMRAAFGDYYESVDVNTITEREDIDARR